MTPPSSQALSQFGENYELISYVLPGRDRKACKNKFKAEDRRNPSRITYCLKNRRPVGKSCSDIYLAIILIVLLRRSADFVQNDGQGFLGSYTHNQSTYTPQPTRG